MSENEGAEALDDEVGEAGEADEVSPILDDSEDEQVAILNASDESDELKGPRFQTQRLGDEGGLGDAYDCLQIRTPLEEFETFARARLETLVKLGEAERAQAASEALETGVSALRHVMGAAQEASQ